MKITTVYPDGTQETLEGTPEELATFRRNITPIALNHSPLTLNPKQGPNFLDPYTLPLDLTPKVGDTTDTHPKHISFIPKGF